MAIGPIIIAIVRELNVDPEIGLTNQGDDLLQAVAVFAGDADDLSVDGGLYLLLGILDELDDLTRLFNGDALLELDLLADGGAGGGLDFAVFKGLERDIALDELGLEDVDDGFELVLVGGGEDEFLLAIKLNVGVSNPSGRNADGFP